MKKRITALVLVNFLTFARLMMVVGLWFWVSRDSENKLSQLAFWLVLMLTDFLDGFLARRLEVTTRFGQYADAFVDKVATFVVACLILWYRGFPIQVFTFLVGIYGYAVVLLIRYRTKRGVWPVSRVKGKIAITAWAFTGALYMSGLFHNGRWWFCALALCATGIAVWDYFQAYGASEQGSLEGVALVKKGSHT